MKKLWILLAGILMAVVVAGCSSGDKNAETVDISGNYVKPGEILEDIEEGKSFGFVIVDKDCSACAAYKAGALKDFEKSNKGELKYVEVNGIEDKEDEFDDVLTLIDDHLDGQFEATPTTYFFTNGVLDSVEVGVMEYDELLEKYNNNVKGNSNENSDDNEDSKENTEDSDNE